MKGKRERKSERKREESESESERKKYYQHTQNDKKNRQRVNSPQTRRAVV